MNFTQKRASKSLMTLMVVLACSVLPTLTFAQAGFETSVGTAPVDPVDAPINGGTVFLIVAGVIFAVYRLYKFTVAKGAPSIN